MVYPIHWEYRVQFEHTPSDGQTAIDGANAIAIDNHDNSHFPVR